MLSQLFHDFLYFLKNPMALIQTAGYVGLTFIIFAETGLLIGFFLPGDSLLISAGLVAAAGMIDIWLLCSLLSVAAILGDAVGYWIGAKAGPLLYQKEDSFFFRKSHLIKTHEFYEKHGGKTIIFARFIPIVRTFAPTVAGIAGMSYPRFAMFNIVGGLLWIWGLGLTGYYLGKTVPNIDQYIHYIIVLVILLSISPAIVKVISNWRQIKADLLAEKNG